MAQNMQQYTAYNINSSAHDIYTAYNISNSTSAHGINMHAAVHMQLSYNISGSAHGISMQ